MEHTDASYLQTYATKKRISHVYQHVRNPPEQGFMLRYRRPIGRSLTNRELVAHSEKQSTVVAKGDNTISDTTLGIVVQGIGDIQHR